MRRRGYGDRGITQRLLDHSNLAIIEIGRPQKLLHLVHLPGFPCQVAVQFTDSTKNDLRMPDQEVGEVTLILLHLTERARILLGRFAQEPRDWHEVHQEESLAKHDPLSNDASRAPVSIDEVMVVAHHEMNNERPHEGRNILRRILAHAIGEVAQALEAFGQLLGCGGTCSS